MLSNVAKDNILRKPIIYKKNLKPFFRGRLLDLVEGQSGGPRFSVTFSQVKNRIIFLTRTKGLTIC
jgi:hypothetical protein